MRKIITITLISIIVYLRLLLPAYDGKKDYSFYNQSVISMVQNIPDFNRNNSSPIIAAGVVTGEIAAGFTLAEVLVTLTIIGIVATLTVPVLIQNVQDINLKTGLKRSYSDLSAATNLLLKDKGNNLKGLCVALDYNCLRDAYKPYVSYVKSCNNPQSEGCWHDIGEMRLFNGVFEDWGWSSGLILNNGSLVIFWYPEDSDNCDAEDPDDPNVLSCGFIYIDVNGFKKPNTVGKDIFAFHITNTGLKPYGVYPSATPPSTGCVEGSTAGNNKGYSCTMKYLMQ